MIKPANILGFSLAILIGFYVAVNNADDRVIVMVCAVCVVGLLGLINVHYRRLYNNRLAKPSD